MKKNLLYLFLFLVLCVAVYVVFFREASPDYTLNEANFSVKNPEDIRIILMTDPAGNKIKLERKENKWILNDSLSPVMNKVNDLLEALKDQRPLEPVVPGSHDAVVKAMSGDHTKVEIYTSAGKTNTFYVARITASNNLTYMLTEGAKRPYIVKLPLQNLFLGLRYTTRLYDWRSKKIMQAHAADIQMIDIAYKDSTQYSFHLELTEKGTPVLTGTGHQPIHTPVNSHRIQSYLRLWDSLYCLGYEDRNRIKDTLLTEGKEIATVRLKNRKGVEQTLTLYFKPISKGTKGIIKVGDKTYDFDVYVGYLNKQDMIIITRNFAQLMLRTYPEFFEGDNHDHLPQTPPHS